VDIKKEEKKDEPSIVKADTENIVSSTSGGLVTIQNPEYINTKKLDENGNGKKMSGKVYLQVISTFYIGHGNISEVKDKNGAVEIGTVGGKATKYDFVAGEVGRGGSGYFSTGKLEYDGKFGPIDAVNLPTWTVANPNYKNFINWSLFEHRGTFWGSGQPTGIFIKDGKYYGAKPIQKGGNITAAIYNDGKRDLRYGSNFMKNGVVTPNIKIAAGGSRLIIEKGQNTNLADLDYRGYPFLGRVKLKNGTTSWFAGASSTGPTPALVANCILGHFQKEGATVIDCAIGDGGGSTVMVVGGKTITGGGRAFPILIYW
jgi:hypothetical protein